MHVAYNIVEWRQIKVSLPLSHTPVVLLLRTFWWQTTIWVLEIVCSEECPSAVRHASEHNYVVGKQIELNLIIHIFFNRVSQSQTPQSYYRPLAITRYTTALLYAYRPKSYFIDWLMPALEHSQGSEATRLKCGGSLVITLGYWTF